MFTIADVRNFILGADFLDHFHLLVDIRHQKLVDAMTRSHIQGVSFRGAALSPAWQVVTPTTPFHALYPRFHLLLALHPSTNTPSLSHKNH